VNAGKLRHAVTVQSVTDGTGTRGAPTKTAATFATTWASIEPLSGAELWRAQQVSAEVTHRVLLRHLSGVTPKMRIKYGSRTLEVVSVLNLEERDRELELLCRELL
jgi:SPP1 family predicted phage head-tail adaptor